MKLTKYFKWLKRSYVLVGSGIVKVLKFFVKPDDKLILFNCYGGKKFDDSPKAIYEGMLREVRFADFKFVWAFHNPDEFTIPVGRKIRTDTLLYFVTALKARCWITNSSIQRGLSFKGKNTFLLNTWHGTPIKKMGIDQGTNASDFEHVDIMTAQGEYEVDIFSRAFAIDRNRFLISGLPRNDILAIANKKAKDCVLKELGIPAGRKVILYAPTFREYERDGKLNCVLAPPIDFEYWNRELGKDHVVLLRAHYEVAKVLNVQVDNEFVYDVSEYPNLSDLMIASDMLIPLCQDSCRRVLSKV
jgi:CDP-glycerol glycerophosphotransferase